MIAAPSMVAMFENFVSVTQEEDVPQVSALRVDSVLLLGFLFSPTDNSGKQNTITYYHTVMLNI